MVVKSRVVKFARNYDLEFLNLQIFLEQGEYFAAIKNLPKKFMQTLSKITPEIYNLKSRFYCTGEGRI